MTAKTGIILAGLLGFFGVAAGAFGAHGLRDRVGPRELEIWHTGAHYQQLHAVVLLAVALWALTLSARGEPTGLHGVAMSLFVAGIAIFSGTLYAITLGGPRVLGAVTPLGGLCLLAGWLTIVVLGLRQVT
ncbi:DUF423 domain-containing protein [Nannocystis pusilla]|uniref:DUF423 domain-containing protein n=1 Tax=Nannocystis pusilla TaxID=889268 RepID=UPI003B8195D5